MGDAYGRRMYHRPPRQEWANSPPQYYGANIADPFGMNGGAYVAPAMIRPGNMGPPMLPGAFQHQAPFTLPPPGSVPTSNMTFRPSNMGARGAMMSSQASQINQYAGHQNNALLSPMQG